MYEYVFRISSAKVLLFFELTKKFELKNTI